ncbi:hypothetical protein GEMRC1_008876 [Eukaryota sp. GEM-RC1]
MANKKFFAIKKGHQTGVFTAAEFDPLWVSGYPGMQYKGFQTLEEATVWFNGDTTSLASTTPIAFFAVVSGRETGVFPVHHSSDFFSIIQPLVSGYPQARYKKFKSQSDAETYFNAFPKGPPKSPEVTPYEPSPSNSSPLPTSTSPLPTSSNPLFSALLPASRTRGADHGAKRSSSLPSPSQPREELPSFFHSSPSTPSEEWIIYTDGSCFNNGTKRARAGLSFALYTSDDYTSCVKCYGPITRNPSNNTGEFGAVLAALYYLKYTLNGKRPKIVFRSDSDLFVKTMNLNYNLQLKHLIKLKCEIRRLLREPPFLIQKAKSVMDITFEWVKAHSTCYGNNVADELARLGASGQSNDVFDMIKTVADNPELFE